MRQARSTRSQAAAKRAASGCACQNCRSNERSRSSIFPKRSTIPALIVQYPSVEAAPTALLALARVAVVGSCRGSCCYAKCFPVHSTRDPGKQPRFASPETRLSGASDPLAGRLTPHSQRFRRGTGGLGEYASRLCSFHTSLRSICGPSPFRRSRPPLSPIR